MKRVLQFTAAIVLAITLAWWFFAGANAGWTKTSVATMKIDAITGIEYPVWEKRFVPGVDFIALGATISGLVLGIAYLPNLYSKKSS
jgi:hypothetical protein